MASIQSLLFIKETTFDVILKPGVYVIGVKTRVRSGCWVVHEKLISIITSYKCILTYTSWSSSLSSSSSSTSTLFLQKIIEMFEMYRYTCTMSEMKIRLKSSPAQMYFHLPEAISFHEIWYLVFKSQETWNARNYFLFFFVFFYFLDYFSCHHHYILRAQTDKFTQIKWKENHISIPIFNIHTHTQKIK